MYYVFRRSPKPRRWIDDEPFISGVSFLRGTKIAKPVPAPLEFTLKRLNPEASDHAPYMPSTLGTRVPLFRNDLLAALYEMGINNLDTYDAVVRDPGTAQEIADYRAVNIIGIVAAADMSKSIATVHAGPPLVDVEFDQLEVDPNKARGFSIFRLAEAVGTVLVHERVRDHLLARGFDDLAFDKPSDVAI
jgi:hypothetical protein